MTTSRVALLAVLAAGCAAPPPPVPAPQPAPRAAGPGAASAPAPVPEKPMAADLSKYRPTVDRILAAAKSDAKAYERLRHLCDRIGNRLSGSEALGKAIAWAAETMRADGLDAVRVEKVRVPRWVRGEGSVELVAPRRQPLRFLELGNSVGTDAATGAPPGDLEADLAVARDWKDLEALGESVNGKIVLFHHPMPPHEPGKDPGYGEAVDYRVNGPSRAAALGAVGCLVCSITARSLATPHTGTLRYAEGAPRIPAAALSPEDSAMLLRLVEAGEKVRVRMRLACRFEPDVESGNVVGEIRGSEIPEEIVLFGGHLDSWDVGQGAHDDGGPSVAVMEAMRLLRSLGLRPRRTVRAVLFVNEENGSRGAHQYAMDHVAEAARTVAALEADSGAFRPLGLGTPFPKPDAEPEARARGERIVARLRGLVALLEGVGAGALTDGGGGADIGPLEPAGVPQIGLEVDMATYFDLHHTHADTFDKVKKEDLDLCAGVLAAAVFVLADMDESLRE